LGGWCGCDDVFFPATLLFLILFQILLNLHCTSWKKKREKERKKERGPSCS
jgi:hypothetical protein